MGHEDSTSGVSKGQKASDLDSTGVSRKPWASWYPGWRLQWHGGGELVSAVRFWYRRRMARYEAKTGVLWAEIGGTRSCADPNNATLDRGLWWWKWDQESHNCRALNPVTH